MKRTVFKMDKSGEVRQYILSDEDLNLSIDIQNFSEKEDPQAACEAHLSLDAQKPFDLIEGPLLRASLIQLSNDKQVFYYNMHHIISDGWSMDILAQDVMEYYEAYRSGQTPYLMPLRIQYKDYTVWQSGQLNNDANQVHKNYWLSRLEGKIPLINLPTNKTRPQLKTYKGRSMSLCLSPATTLKLRNFTRKKGSSLFVGLLTIWKILLYRYTGQTDITIGNIIAGREHPDLSNQIGFYVNTLAIRNKINPATSFAKFCDEVKTNTLDAYAHQMYPFDKIVEDLQRHRDTSRNPIFDILVNHNGVVSQSTSSFDESEGVQDLGTGIIKFDLAIDFTEINDFVGIVVNYNVCFFPVRKNILFE